MAREADVSKIKSHHLFRMLPDEIVYDDKENSRHTPHSEEEIKATAESILEVGQIQPIVLRKIDGGRLKLVAGYGRVKAVKYINTVLQPDHPVKLLCRVVDANAEEAFAQNVKENLDRKELSPIDIAHAQRRFEDVHGWPKERIATFFNKSVAYLGSLKALLRLETTVQQAVSNGDLGVAAALDLAKLPEEKRAEVVKEATDPETGKVDPAPIRAAVRERQQENGSGKQRTVKEIKQFLAAPLDPAEYAGRKSVRLLANALIEFINGKIDDAAMIEALDEQCREAEAKSE